MTGIMKQNSFQILNHYTVEKWDTDVYMKNVSFYFSSIHQHPLIRGWVAGIAAPAAPAAPAGDT